VDNPKEHKENINLQINQNN